MINSRSHCGALPITQSGRFAALAFCLLGLLGGCASTDNEALRAPTATEDKARTIMPGMRAAEVIQLLGAPHQRVRFDNLRATAWDYRYTDTWGYITDFAVMIGDDERVVNVVATRVVPVDK